MKYTHKRNFISIAMAAVVLVSLCSVCVSPLSVSAVQESNGNVLSPAMVGEPVAGAPAVCSVYNSKNLDLFVKGTDGALWWKHWDYTWATWSMWQSLGGSLTSDPAAVSRGAGKIDVFVRGTDNALWSKYTTDGGTSWSNWYKIGGQLLSGTGPAAYAWGDTRIGAFVTGTNKALYHIWNDGAWSSWQSLGGILTSSPAATSPSGVEINVYGRGNDGALWQREYMNNAWSNWASLGGKISPGTGPAACYWGQGTLDVFVQGTNGALWYKFREPTISWSSWISLGGILTSSPAVVGTASGARVYVRGGDNNLWSIAYEPGSGWKPFHAGASTP
jgi:hypothetical protein